MGGCGCSCLPGRGQRCLLASKRLLEPHGELVDHPWGPNGQRPLLDDAAPWDATAAGLPLQWELRPGQLSSGTCHDGIPRTLDPLELQQQHDAAHDVFAQSDAFTRRNDAPRPHAVSGAAAWSCLRDPPPSLHGRPAARLVQRAAPRLTGSARKAHALF